MLSTLLAAGEFIRGINVLGLSWLEWVGLVATVVLILYQVPCIFWEVYCIWIAPILGHNANLREMGSWAVVTGASDGIGKAYAEELARLGINVVLISRTLEKLERVATEIQKEFKVKTKVLVVDFTESGSAIYDRIEEEIKDLDVGTLVNNVGMWYPYAEFFMDLPNGDKYSLDMINCNVTSLTLMTRIVLRQMCPRRKGVIINVGSLSSVLPVPLMAVYSATKAYLERFSESLSMEYEAQGIIVQTLLPAYVCTKMSRVSKPSFFSPSPTEFVQRALKTVGVESVTSVHLPHRFSRRAQTFGWFFMPEFAMRVAFNASLVLRSMKLKRLKERSNKST